MKIVIIDNYDSFTYNLVEDVKKLSGLKVDVFRNDEIAPDDLEKYDKIILSPGPGIPVEAGSLMDIIRKYAPYKSILGVCLGHQAIGEVFGAHLSNMEHVFHGVSTPIIQKNSDPVLYKDVPREFQGGRYHSWIVDQKDFPDCLEVTAEDKEGRIMSLRHKKYDVRGVQFHPESVLTPLGEKIIDNWIHS